MRRLIRTVDVEGQRVCDDRFIHVDTTRPMQYIYHSLKLGRPLCKAKLFTAVDSPADSGVVVNESDIIQDIIEGYQEIGMQLPVLYVFVAGESAPDVKPEREQAANARRSDADNRTRKKKGKKADQQQAAKARQAVVRKVKQRTKAQKSAPAVLNGKGRANMLQKKKKRNQNRAG